jgi:ApaG protein
MRQYPRGENAGDSVKGLRRYYRMTDGIRISVQPVFAPEHSNIDEPRFVFVYFIRIENLGDVTLQLLWRHWDIHDDAAGDTEVEGEGVVGEQPILAPGEVHEYNSFCVLRGPRGYMEGWYEFRTSTGEKRRASIPKFVLTAE